MQVSHCLFDGFGSRPHHDDDAFCFRMPDVVEEVILSAGKFRKRVHRVLHDRRRRVVERVRGLPGLEEDIRILGGATKRR